MARFRIANGKILVIHPDNRNEEQFVTLIVDLENNALGVKINNGELKGTCIFAAQKSFDETAKKGLATDTLRR